MSDQADPLTEIMRPHFSIGLSCACGTDTRDFPAHLAQVIRAAYPTEYGVLRGSTVDVLGRSDTKHLPGIVKDLVAESFTLAEAFVSRPVIPWRPIKEQT